MGKKPANTLPEDDTKDVTPDPPTLEDRINAVAASARNAVRTAPNEIRLMCYRCDPDGELVIRTGDETEAAAAARKHAEEFPGAAWPHGVIPKPVEDA